MLYLSQMMGKPVVDATGEKIGTISDLAISTGEVFPRITSLAFQGPGKVPFMISWRKYVNGLILPMLLVFMALISADKRIMGTYRLGRVPRALIWLTVGIVTVLTAALLVMQVLGIG